MPESDTPNELPRRPLLAPAERAQRIKAIRLSLTPQLGYYVAQGEFGRLVATAAGLKEPLSQSSAARWEDENNPAEPGLILGAAIATLGRRSAEWLVYADAPDVLLAPPATLPAGFARADEAQSPDEFFAGQQHAAGRGLSGLRPRVAAAR